eukprot:TRINITY_DN112489_c0_g1_i1.p1 TRINITY_DN112489_c0_g1~~TRINITY_DN112489_c0_g1_i1.p1  ORF type:complete len:432 (+),score=26.38 TRINITY_DN112489_c0_g1_i1:32-1327(+)
MRLNLCKRLLQQAAPLSELQFKPISGLPKTRGMYLDFQATTPMDPRVLDAMMPYMTEIQGNAHSRTHSYGWAAEEAVEKARAQVASLIGATADEVVFTSGATESNNIAVKGIAKYRQKEGKTHIITAVTEHKCVLDSCRYLEGEGFTVTYLPVKRDGLIELDALEEAITDKTCLVSIMTVNNEVGVIQPISDIAALCKKRKIAFHTDAAQAIGRVPINVHEMGIGLMSMSGHKIYGPKGIGGLFVRRKPRVRLESPVSGGGHERGMRSGTLPTPLIVGFGEACEIAQRERERDWAHVQKLSDLLWNGLCAKIPVIQLNGSKTERYPGNLNISFEGVEGESLLLAIDDIAISSGSACTSSSLEPSYVLRALQVSEETAHTSLRFGIGRFTTEQEVNTAIEMLSESVATLRERSPLWDMLQDGNDPKQQIAYK